MGLLPLSPCATPEPPDTNCAWLADAGAEVLAAALDGLLPFIPPTGGPCEDTFDTYLSMGPPVAEQYDALSIYLLRLGPTPTAATRMAANGSCDGIYPKLQAQWEVQLWLNCWPQARRVEDHFVLPAPEKLSNAAEWMLAYGIATYNSTMLASIGDTWEMPAQITNVSIGDLTPLGPQGQAVGWKFPISMVVG